MNETEVRALLIRGTVDRPPGLNLMAALPRVQPQREHRRIWTLVPLGAAAAVAAALTVVALTLPVGQPSAHAQMAAAVESMNQQSYRIHGTSGNRTFEGVFDPVRRVGVIAPVGEGSETRFIGDLVYMSAGAGTTWEVARRMEVADVPVTLAVIKLAVLDPAQTLQRLRSATDVREGGDASGDGWTGQRFTFSLPDMNDSKPLGTGSRTITGAVDVDEQGRVRRLQVDFGVDGERNVTQFSDFGIAVTVTAPPADQVQPQIKRDGGKPSKQATDSTAKPVQK